MSDDNILPEVTRFVVKLPSSYAHLSRDLRAKLDSAFPEQRFTLESVKQTAQQKLALLPVMEDKTGKAEVCRAPDRSLVNRIYDVLNEFTLGLEVTPA